METRQMTPFFSSTVYAVCNIHFYIWKSQNPFTFGPPFGPFWSVKYLNFGQKSPIQSTHHTFLESRHPENTKNPYYVLSSEWSQKKVSAHGLQCLQIKSRAPKKAGECQFDNLTLSHLDAPKMIFLEKRQSPVICDFFGRYEDVTLQF